jgi:hypothetical protein
LINDVGDISHVCLSVSSPPGAPGALSPQPRADDLLFFWLDVGLLLLPPPDRVARNLLERRRGPE